MRVGLIVRMDKSGLGQGQTLRLAKLLKPEAIMLIDSSYFNGSEQHPYWYSADYIQSIRGFPTDEEIRIFLKNCDIVVSCELFYSDSFTKIAKEMGVKTVLIANYEFFDWLQPHYTALLPDKIISPSYWHLDELERDYKATYLPTPIFGSEFKKARETNMSRTGDKKYLFINGKQAIHDRNGLETLYRALELSTGDYSVTVKYQGDIKKHPDPRITYDNSNPTDQSKLYKDFDALVLPRRYAGQSLPMTEALMSGLPVFMTDISPNDEVLPNKWLIKSIKTGEFMTRTMIDIYEGDARELADLLDSFDASFESKQEAYEIGMQYDAKFLKEEYEQLIQETLK